jgi:glycosyltransferase involved in cell wall biosynthesis
MNNLSKLKQKSVICLPVLNEENAIGIMINQIKELNVDFFISDGGSSDKSISIAKNENVEIFYRKGKGKGFGIIQAIKQAQNMGKEFLVLIDCDCTYPVNMIELFIDTIGSENCDVVIGNRCMKEMTLKSKFLNKLLYFSVRILYGDGIQDPASGFRVIKISKFDEDYWDKEMLTEIEMSIDALNKKLKIKNIDIKYSKRVGDSKLKIANILKVPILLLAKKFTVK